MRFSIVGVLSILGLLIVLTLMAFAVYTLFFDKPFYEADSYTSESFRTEEESGTIDSDRKVDRLEIRNISGRISAVGWGDNQVRLDYRKFGPGQPPEVEVDYQGSTMVIKAVYPKKLAAFGSIDFEIKVPDSVRYIDAGSVSGSIRLSEIGNDVEQKLSTTSGSVKTDSSGNLDISSVSGSLEFSSSGSRITASTTSGRIAGALEEDHGSGKIELSSVSGRVVLEVPENLNADVDLHSVSGSVSSDLPVSVTESRKKSLRGRIGSGGTIIDIGTVSGSIKIRE
ncbi:MAG: DUF4097 family beta strand repeat protein [Spirochaetales bacterium]|nr:DUF4097 family beta strand repeat protein [Spirochaetales bacterium]